MDVASDIKPWRPWVDHYPPGVKWDSPIDTTPVHEQVLATCDRQDGKHALDFLGAKTTYADLGRQIRAFAGALQRDFAVGKGTRVAIMLPNTPFYPVAYYAVLSVGGIVVNCNPLYATGELAHITGNADADIMITLDLKVIFDKAEELVKRGIVKKLIVCHFPDALPPVKKVLFSLFKGREVAKLNTSPAAAIITAYGDLIAKGLHADPVTIDPRNDIAVQQYTGGTTGLPKGAMLTHANIAANLSQIDYWGGDVFREPNKVVAVIPFFHIFAMTVCMNTPLSNGIEVVMLPRFELKALLDTFVRTRATVLPAVPTLLHAIANSPKTTREHMKSLKVAVSGGAALASETRAAFAKISDAILAEGYGLTETSPVACCASLKTPSKPMSVGQPLPATDIRFLDVDDPGKIMQPGERGEIAISGPQVMPGYYKDEEGTRAVFADGYFRTGDVGYADEDGYIFLVDRIKDLIICSGFNVYPRAIEEAIYHHAAVDECNVIGVPDDYRGEAPVAFVKLKEGAELTEEELLTFLEEHLSRIEMPREIIFKDALPKTLVGKLSKKELREEYQAATKKKE